MIITSRPIHFTSNKTAVIQRLRVLGLTRIVGDSSDCWQVFSAPAGGRIAVHEVDPGDELDAISQLGFEVPDAATLKQLAESFSEIPGEATVRIIDTDHGKALRIAIDNDLQFLVDIADSEIAQPNIQPGIEVAQMWFTNHTNSAREVLLRLGAKELVTNQSFAWDDARMPGGGRTQLHIIENGTTARASVGFMSAQPLEALKQQVELAGEDVSIVDEAWGRYLELPQVTVKKPETGLDGELTWVNEEKDDYYGYQLLQDPKVR